jgi:hypothetical protein
MGRRWEFIRERLRFRFSLRGLMVFTFGVAVGLALVNREKPDWPAAALNALTVWLVLGLINQVRDLWTTFRGRTDLDFDERWTWRMAAAWRIVAASMLVGLVGLEFVRSREIFRFQSEEYLLPDPRDDSLRSTYWLLVLIAIFPIGTGAWMTWPRTALSWIRLSGIGTICIALAIRLFIHWLVYLSVIAMDRSEPLRFANSPESLDMTSRASEFVFWSCVAIVVAMSNVVSLFLLVAARRRLRLHAGLLASWLGLGGAVATGYTIWLMTIGWRLLDEHWSASFIQPSPSTIASIAALVLTFTLAAAYRLNYLSTFREFPPRRLMDWRRHSERHFHERLGFQVAFACVTIVVGYYAIQEWMDFASILDDLSVISSVFMSGYVGLAALILSIQAAWRLWWRPIDALPDGLTAMPVKRFLFIWLALLAIIVTAIPAFAGFSFSLWLTPWWKLPVMEW